jgi:hypothetical protein
MEVITRKVIETICCVCQRKKGENGWEKGMIKPFADLSHGYCPECYQKIMIDYGLASTVDLPFDLHQREARG